MSSDNPYYSWSNPAPGSPEPDDGSFAVPGDVSWGDSGFGDEDLAVPATPAPKQPLTPPRPTEPTPPPLVGDTEIPDWAILPPTFDTPPTPAAPPSFTPPSFSQPPVAVPASPAPPAAPMTWQEPAPVHPLPLPDTEVPDWAHIAPSHVAPAATEPVFGTPDDEAFPSGAGDSPAPPSQPAPVVQPVIQPTPAARPAAQPVTTSTVSATQTAAAPPTVKKLFGIPLPPAWQDDPEAHKNSRTARTDRKPTKQKTLGAAGGRWQVKLFRVIAWCVLAVLLFGGLKNVLSPRKAPDIKAISQQVAGSLGENGFPTASANAFAIRFAQVYLTYSSKDTTDTRTHELALYAPTSLTDTTGWQGSGDQQVLNGPLVASPATLLDKHNAVIQVAAQVTGGKWVYLAVPVYADNNGNLVVSGPPGFTPPPAMADSPGMSGPSGDLDTDLAGNLAETTLPGFFTAWAASDATALQRYVTPKATAATHIGLSGAVTFHSVDNVIAPTGGNERDIRVDVSWNAGSAGTYEQSYRLTVDKLSNGQWFVQDIKGGYVSESAAPSLTGDTPTSDPSASSDPAGD